MTTPKKLIEVALPLDAINKASAREKSIRHGHPSTLHLWWARRPLAAARAVIFAQMVDDPSAHPDLFPTERLQQKERERLFRVIEELVQWESTTNEKTLRDASDEIQQSWRYTCAANVDDPRAKDIYSRKRLPPFYDPFAGGGALPLEAQRLGLTAFASDLNPVAVLINRAMIEMPAQFAGRPPVHPGAKRALEAAGAWNGSRGLAEDVRLYGAWIRDKAHERIGLLYPTIRITDPMVRERPDMKKYKGRELTVFSWIWVRTVRSPNPAFADVEVPLASSFVLSPMADKEAYVEAVVAKGAYEFKVHAGKPKDPDEAKRGTSAGKRAAFKCVMSGTPIPYDYIRAEGQAGRMGMRLMAVVAEGERERVYLSPTSEMEKSGLDAHPEWVPDTQLHGKCRVNVSNYGLDVYGDVFTPRQLVALTTFADLVSEAREMVRVDASSAGLGDLSATYADAVATYLGFLVSKLADKGSALCTWNAGPASSRTASGRSAAVATVRSTFARQALQMSWDFAEVNFFSESAGSIDTVLRTLTVPLDYTPPRAAPGVALQADAVSGANGLDGPFVISTDPPYYDNIGYADLSDFFYVWLRRSLRSVFPELFATVAVPKSQELVATPYRHGTKEKAEAFFLDGMTRAMQRLAELAHPAFPVTIYYAFKQAETDGEAEGGRVSTGWDTFLEAVIRAGFAITGTWPIRTERSVRSVGLDSNALASSIILVCRKRVDAASALTRREFIAALKSELPSALANLQRGNIAPVDLAQAAIGPGMAVFTRYEKVLDASGRSLAVSDALSLINQVLDESLAEQEGDFDADSRWALAWFEQVGFAEGEYGVAETLSKAKNTSVKGLEEAGILKSSRGKVRLLKTNEIPADWDPGADERLTAWEVVHHLIRALDSRGELGAAALVVKLGVRAEVARELAYRLYTTCERKKRAAEALAYNGLVQSWPEITRLAREGGKAPKAAQGALFEKDEG